MRTSVDTSRTVSFGSKTFVWPENVGYSPTYVVSSVGQNRADPPRRSRPGRELDWSRSPEESYEYGRGRVHLFRPEGFRLTGIHPQLRNIQYVHLHSRLRFFSFFCREGISPCDCCLSYVGMNSSRKYFCVKVTGC